MTEKRPSSARDVLSIAALSLLANTVDGKATEVENKGDQEALNAQNKVAKVLIVDSLKNNKSVDFSTIDYVADKYHSSRVKWIPVEEIPADYDYVRVEQEKEKVAWRPLAYGMIHSRFKLIERLNKTIEKYKAGEYGISEFKNAISVSNYDLENLNGFLNGYDKNGDGKVQPLFDKTPSGDGKTWNYKSKEGSDIAGIDWHISKIKETIDLPDNDKTWSAKLDSVRGQEIAYLEDIKQLVTDARNSMKLLQSEFQYIVENWDNIVLVRKANAQGNISAEDLGKLSLAEWNKIRGQVQSYSMSQDINKEKGYSSVATRE